ncbi:MAG: leucine-rich repeat protein [Bacteroidaceae bacterium]|nr:leucine-rich repeat protein [Bacteroidaceae bacterium]
MSCKYEGCYPTDDVDYEYEFFFGEYDWSSEDYDSIKGLSAITISSSIISIGDRAFAGCRSLSEILIPSSLTEISNGLFQNCHSLDSVKIPSSVTSIGDNAFYVSSV